MADQAEESDEKDKESDSVNSSSLIKFAASEHMNFSTLQCSLNLKQPPHNWLNGQIKMSKTSVASSSIKFSSFKIAFDFYQELNKVDVISDSENIKNILKLAYNPNASLSYFVHKVGNSLLIDEFNLHRWLLWNENEEWKWLKSFVYENILGSMKGKPIPIQHKTREFLEQKNLLSKFLYYSVEDSKRIEEKEHVPVLPFDKALLPQPKLEYMELPDNYQYSRNILWNFEDINMLIGSDMQIFGNQNRPCISLRLRDMKEPINVLTGIDYWLDNLMHNIPEIFMCYHLDGIVQKYELLKTEDLPDLENSKFSPKVIRNVAQNILSFLKQNATKSGHTYWLFKGQHDDVVKLYDLTTLELIAKEKEKSHDKDSTKEDMKSQSPFTHPAGILMYTLARNLKYSNDKLTSKQAGNIKHLLDNCLKLLPKEKYPQIITTSHYILSDLQIQNTTDPTNPECIFDEESDSDEYEPFEEQGVESDNETDECYYAVQNVKETISKHDAGNQKSNKPAPLVLGNIIERTEESLKNLVSGLHCLKYFKGDSPQSKEKEKEQILHEEQNPNILHDPDIAIPMPWADENSTNPQSKRGDSPESEASSNNYLDSKSLLMRGDPNLKTWNTHLKVLIFEKASLSYACLAEHYYNTKCFGTALKNLRLSILCQSVVKKHVPSMTTQENILYGRAGDCYFQMSKLLSNIPIYGREFYDENELDKDIIKELENEELSYADDIIAPEENEEKMLEAGARCYEYGCIDINQSKYEIIRRLGNVYNELGVVLMHKSQRIYNEYIEEYNKCVEKEEKSENSINTTELSYQQVAKTSYDYLMKAVSLFESVKDSLNLIICHLNLGRFYRLSAHINIFHEFNAAKSLQMQKKLYQQSFDNYSRAKEIIESRKKNPELWDMVCWELSTALFNLAKQMQENGTTEGSTEELEREVLDMLNKALESCDLITNSSRQVLYVFRAGLIHQRIASLHHQSLRTICDDSKKRKILQICRSHYEKASNFLASLNEFKDYLKVQMERVALQEYLAEECSSASSKIKNYHAALKLLVESEKILKSMCEAKSIMDSEEVLTLLELFEKRLQFVLKSLIKLTTCGKKPDLKGEIYKKMFAATLRTNQKLNLDDLCYHLVTVLEKMEQFEVI